MVRNLAVLFSAFMLATSARAACMRAEQNRVATVVVGSCRSVADVATERLGNTTILWIRSHVERTVARAGGVVLAGQVIHKVHIEQFGDAEFRFLDSMAADETGLWFVRGERLTCDAFQPGSSVQIYATEKCCDVFPPMDVACLLDLDQATTVTDSLHRFLRSSGL